MRSSGLTPETSVIAAKCGWQKPPPARPIHGLVNGETTSIELSASSPCFAGVGEVTQAAWLAKVRLMASLLCKSAGLPHFAYALTQLSPTRICAIRMNRLRMCFEYQQQHRLQ